MYATVSITSFIFDMLVVFYLPYQKVEKMYDLPKIPIVSLQFLIIGNENFLIKEDNARRLMFETFLSAKLKNRLDLPHKYFKNVRIRDETLGKQVGLF